MGVLGTRGVLGEVFIEGEDTCVSDALEKIDAAGARDGDPGVAMCRSSGSDPVLGDPGWERSPPLLFGLRERMGESWRRMENALRAAWNIAGVCRACRDGAPVSLSMRIRG
jgi:hypothetical protein